MKYDALAVVLSAMMWSIAIFTLFSVLTGCSEMKYVVKCTTDINANCN